MTVVALMLSRGGSTGLPGKNVRLLLGRPVMAYPLIAANDSKHVDRVFVSTDSDEIKAVGRQYGAEIIDRPDYLCTPEALGEDAYRHGYHWIKDKLASEGEEMELICCLFANSPCITGDLIDQGIERLRTDETLDSAITASKLNMWSPLRARRLTDEGILQPFVPFETFGDPATLSCDRDSQGDVWFYDSGVVVARPRALEHLDEGLLPQKWMGQRIALIPSTGGGADIDEEWQLPMVEFWLTEHGIEPAEAAAAVAERA